LIGVHRTIDYQGFVEEFSRSSARAETQDKLPIRLFKRIEAGIIATCFRKGLTPYDWERNAATSNKVVDAC
jgi:hypothetical protein